MGFQRKVVDRAVHILSLPCSYEPEFSLNCNAKLSHLLDVPGLISVKLKLCNVALYDGDILGMNLKADSAVNVCELMHFHCMQTRHSYDTKPQISAMMMFLKAVCKYNGKVRPVIKKYIFGDDAEEKVKDSDEESDTEPEMDTKEKMEEAKAKERNEMMRPKALDEVADGEETIKNYLIKCCTDVNYSVKRIVAEFLFALCGDDQKEMIRLCGLGNAIGIFVDKGIPGFVGAADNAMNLDQMTKLRNKSKEKEKDKKKSGDKEKEKDKK